MNVHGDSVNAYCRFQLQDEEALYGLGQFRDNLMNLRNAKRELVQFNTQACSTGYLFYRKMGTVLGQSFPNYICR